MKYVKLIIFIIIAVSIARCSTTPVPYSLAADGDKTAAVNIVRGNPGLRTCVQRRLSKVWACEIINIFSSCSVLIS
jgi:hypothetical protein